MRNLIKKILRESDWGEPIMESTDFDWVEDSSEMEDFNNFLKRYGYSIIFYRDSDKKDYMLKLEDKVIMYRFGSRFEVTINSVVKDIKNKIKDLKDPNDELTATGWRNLTMLKRLRKIIKKELGI